MVYDYMPKLCDIDFDFLHGRDPTLELVNDGAIVVVICIDSSTVGGT